MNIVILLGSVRNNREGIKIAKFAQRLAVEQGWNATLVDAVEWEIPLMHNVYRMMEDPSPILVKLHDLLEKADGFIFIATEYNHSIPPSLKNMIDYFYEEYFYKPCGIISYTSGPFGGIRAAHHLSDVCSALKMVVIPTILPISKVRESFNDDGTSVDGVYERRSKKFIAEMNWFLEALSLQRKKGLPTS